jgi:prepilin signal peptidase PulO-like enzyme (type II secretory pathway)
MILTISGWFFLFACAGTCGVIAAHLICASVSPAQDGPAPSRLHPVIPILIFAGVGAMLAARGAAPHVLGLIALLCVPLAGAWQADALKGIVPDELTLIPLAIVAVGVVLQRSWWVAGSAIVIFIAFALSSFFSKGRGMGWGDTKLATLCAAILGLQSALLTLSLACFAATAVSVVRDRGTRPIAFAPYMVCGVLAALLLTIHA